MADNNPLARTQDAWLKDPSKDFAIDGSQIFIKGGVLRDKEGINLAMKHQKGKVKSELRAIGWFPPPPDDKTKIIYCADVQEDPTSDKAIKTNLFGYTNLLKEVAKEILTNTDERQIIDMMKYLGYVRQFCDEYVDYFDAQDKFVLPDEVGACETYAMITLGEKKW